MKIDYDIIRKELEKLSKEEIIEMSVLLPKNISDYYKLKEKNLTLTMLFRTKRIQGPYQISKYLSKEEAIKIVHPFKFQTMKEFHEWRDKNKRKDFPRNAGPYYKMLWGDFLGNGKKGSKFGNYLSKDEAFKIVCEHNLTSSTKYINFKKKYNRKDLPWKPIVEYNTTYYEFFKKVDFLSKKKAIKLIRSLKFNTTTEYFKWRKDNNIKYLPMYASRYYKTTWKDILGNGVLLKCDRDGNFIPLEDALKIIYPLKFKSMYAYREWILKSKISYLPINASRFYKVPWKELLGNSFLSKEEALKIVHPLKFKNLLEYNNWRKKTKINGRLPRDPARMYKISTKEFLGKDDARL